MYGTTAPEVQLGSVSTFIRARSLAVEKLPNLGRKIPTSFGQSAELNSTRIEHSIVPAFVE